MNISDFFVCVQDLSFENRTFFFLRESLSYSAIT